MKAKKNPKKDMNRSKGLYFVIGLLLVLALTYTALEWKFYESSPYDSFGMNEPDILQEEIPPIILKEIPPPPPPVTPTIIEIAPDDVPIIESVIEATEPNQDTAILDVHDIFVEEEPEDILIPLPLIEEVPVFPGCENEKDKRMCFQKMMTKHVNKNIRYPEIAQEMGIQGRVSTVFEIQKDGSIGNVKLRGPDKNLEKEAARILSKLPKMQPGKHGGKPVRVSFALPINFKLE